MTPPNAVRNAPLKALDAFVGRWRQEIRWSEASHKLVGGPPSVRMTVTFDWIEDGGFLVHRAGGGGAPASRWAIGPDDTTGAYTALYADERGVSRLYQMSLERSVWRLWRDAPGFRQRFVGQFNDTLTGIEARWEKAVGDGDWTLDFEMTYAKAV